MVVAAGVFQLFIVLVYAHPDWSEFGEIQRVLFTDNNSPVGINVASIGVNLSALICNSCLECPFRSRLSG